MKIGLAILVFFAVFNLINFKKKVSLHSPKEKIKLKNMHELSGKGEFKIYYENGKISTIGNYHDFKLEGNYISFYENGSIASDGFYKNGLLDGEWKFYSKNGSLERIEKYENGEKIENN
ncbi:MULTISPECIES: toxin-antitoxin system YwqK family antitoxin [Fusobacterium]|uniref:MORN repeat variant n=3 Tax=Fusobacterium ulcerans TaxID=861 RepID=A0AAX1TNT4_9FUSO|nr:MULTISPECIES: hypothetical protein [Fusobacterium]AVQ29349.1 hypothetical protein C4N20_15030 [Fusobacterium ulcerans]EFS27239.1 hypothetical protein FUAG_02754 [Fusobacterium ulcerans ATCC 49185]EPC09098.1 hypothetical protein HMPREF0402_04176 [Fusobacterium ulcerans 12-1B]MCB8565455.1 hypothetical protein [Fusobacterium ulcerans]MCB8649458.1 hypothetical protein [Fusobacterium ulcerans]